MGRAKLYCLEEKKLIVRMTNYEYEKLRQFSKNHNTNMTKTVKNALELYYSMYDRSSLFCENVLCTILEIFDNLIREDIEDIVKNHTLYVNFVKKENFHKYELEYTIAIVESICKELYKDGIIEFIPNIETIKYAYSMVIK